MVKCNLVSMHAATYLAVDRVRRNTQNSLTHSIPLGSLQIMIQRTFFVCHGASLSTRATAASCMRRLDGLLDLLEVDRSASDGGI